MKVTKISLKLLSFPLALVAFSCLSLPAPVVRQCVLDTFLRPRLPAETIDCGQYDLSSRGDPHTFEQSTVWTCVNQALAQRQNFVAWIVGFKLASPDCRTEECPSVVPVITNAWAGRRTDGKYRVEEYINREYLSVVGSIEQRSCVAGTDAALHLSPPELTRSYWSILCAEADSIPMNELANAMPALVCGAPVPNYSDAPEAGRPQDW